MTLKEYLKEYYDFLRATPWVISVNNEPAVWQDRWDYVTRNISRTVKGTFVVDDIRDKRPGASPLVFEKGSVHFSTPIESKGDHREW
jgi:hypothetical protein